MRFQSILILVLLFIGPGLASAQHTNVIDFEIERSATVVISEIDEDWAPTLQYLELPHPSSKSERSSRGTSSSRAAKTARMPIIDDTWIPVVKEEFRGNSYNNRTPNDNDIAVSKNGMMVSVINATINIYDVFNDVLLESVSLDAFADNLGLVNTKFDPRTLYDPIEDKFIIVFLNGALDSLSRIITAFSATNDPTGEWHLYAIPGNPANSGTWSDYPQIAMSDDELFITVNTFLNHSSNNSGFVESAIWQIDRLNGYQGLSLNSMYYNGIEDDGESLFTLTPVKSITYPSGFGMYFMSNSAVDTNWTNQFYLLHVTGSLTRTPSLNLTPIEAEDDYRSPPLARQPQGHMLDPNDARVLGGFLYR